MAVLSRPLNIARPTVLVHRGPCYLRAVTGKGTGAAWEIIFYDGVNANAPEHYRIAANPNETGGVTNINLRFSMGMYVTLSAAFQAGALEYEPTEE